MNKQEETYFAALSKDRSEIADVLDVVLLEDIRIVLLKNILTRHTLFMNYCRMQMMLVQQELDLFLKRIDLFLHIMGLDIFLYPTLLMKMLIQKIKH